MNRRSFGDDLGMHDLALGMMRVCFSDDLGCLGYDLGMSGVCCWRVWNDLVAIWVSFGPENQAQTTQTLLAVWLAGCLDRWLPGLLAAWLAGCLAA